jgi:RimJ/RimL family protein N-acetyltransferase
MLNDLELMQLHVEAEFTHDANGCLLSTNEPTPARAPRFFLGCTSLGFVRRYRHDVSPPRRQALEAAIRRLDTHASDVARPLDPTPFEKILAEDAPIEHTSVGLAYRFPQASQPASDARALRDPADAALLHPLLAPWAPDIQSSAPLVALIVDGQAVAVCGSVRITPRAHEAGVETAAPFRGRGYGRAVVAGWAAAVRALGVEPVYSTIWQNTASRALARATGLEPVGCDMHIS